MVSTQEKFSVFIPFELEKSEKTGEDRYKDMKIKGIASNPNTGKDRQGQWLDPSGFDLSDFLSGGTLNYHHLWKDKPSTVIGEPIKAHITKSNELYIEGRLYSNSKIAREVYDLAEVLEKDSKTRRLGFSIEGFPEEKDPKDKNRITKARITNIAITPSPVCKGTRMDIMKGGFDDIQFETQEDSEYIIDTTVDGVRYTVDKNLEICKAMEAGCETGRDTTDKAMTQQPLKEESIDGVTKKGKKKKKESEENKKSFSKAETVLYFFSTFNNIDADSIKNLWHLTEQIQKSLTPDMAEASKVSKEAIEKALATLNLSKAETAPIQKSVQEVEKEQLQAQYDEAIKKAEDLKNKIDGKVVVATVSEVQEIQKGLVTEEFMKAMDSKFEALGTLVQSKDEVIEAQNASIEEMKKAIDGLTEFNNHITRQVKVIGAQPMDRKSVTPGAKYLEKGQEAEVLGTGKGARKININNKAERKVLVDLMFDTAFVNGKLVDEEFAKAVTPAELGSLGGTPDESVRLSKRLREEHNIVVVRE